MTGPDHTRPDDASSHHTGGDDTNPDDTDPDDTDPDDTDPDEAGPDDTGPDDTDREAGDGELPGSERAEPAEVHPGPADRAVAVALADAFLAGRWLPAELHERGGRVLGARPPWLAPLVTTVLNAYRVAPLDRPREFAGFIAATERFRVAAATARRGGRPLRVRLRLVRPTGTVRSRWDTPVLHNLAGLATFLGLTDDELDWYADRRWLNRHAGAAALHHYHYTWLPGRLIEAPKARLRALHRRLLAELFGRIPVHDAVHGFMPGRSAHTFAGAHAGRSTVVRVDLTSFFASVTAPRVYGMLRTAGYPEPVAHTLAALCTTRTPAGVVRAAPAGLPQRAYRQALLRQPHLPQGAPTSPVLANLCGYRLDRRLAGLAAAFDVVYTRYADDLAFSGDLSGLRARALVTRVETIAAQEGFRAHPAKTRIRGQGDRQLLAGLVVNHRPAVTRQEYDQLRAVLHDAARHGLDAANRDRRPDFAGYLTGRVAWLGHRHPARAAKLRALLGSALGDPDVLDRTGDA